MAFVIHFTTLQPRPFDDEYTLVVKEAGVLEVRTDGKQVAMYSPNYWTWVEPS